MPKNKFPASTTAIPPASFVEPLRLPHAFAFSETTTHALSVSL
ncbi:hypothetical protein CFter6_1695 [Collimonas fungivorans]|uniref:Uncharacterized protein n=1 Tax=Collimonas fungivorans TaxID=158899 RepID=A0A127P9F4_9BURK|nr:hypothetical protein CFter6_1695 [Collimonas fungivorans]